MAIRGMIQKFMACAQIHDTRLPQKIHHRNDSTI